MADSCIASLASFDNGNPLVYVEKNGEILFTAEEVGRHLGYGNPTHAIHRLFRKNYGELKLYAVETKLVSTDGKAYDTRLFTEEGVYILSMLARTNEAKKFRAKVALLLRRVRAEVAERQIALAREAALAEVDGVRHTALAVGARAAFRLTPERRRRLRRALIYREKGLSIQDIATLLGKNGREVSHLLKTAELLGMTAPQGKTGAARVEG